MGRWVSGKVKSPGDELSIEKNREFSIFLEKNHILHFVKKIFPFSQPDKLTIKKQKNETPNIPYDGWVVIGWEK